jgi:hypothetical protein
MIIRETKREFSESLPFDFNSSPHLTGIVNILQELKDTSNYDIELNNILEIYNENELSVSEKNMYLVHFFKTDDLKKHITEFPASANDYIKEDVINDVKLKFKKRFKRLLEILNDKKNTLCFLRIENYENYGWKEELKLLTNVLSLFENPNKYLIYSQILIDEKLDFNKSNVLNYDYDFPILFYKYYFYDLEIINNKDHFINIFNTFESILNSKSIIDIKNNDIIEKYYINNNTMFKLTNIKYFSQCYIDDNDTLYINNVITGYDKYIKNNNIYEKIYNENI